jgi:hypothetical protein
VYRVETLTKKGMIHVPREMEQDTARVQHATQNGMRFTSSQLLISKGFHLMFSDCG